ncbi:MAG: ATP-dependent RecD-like DNA helicase [Desulfobacula sp.]|uniref:SF1B family DNA helicase RecD2 n=1 Tax=Desulfobacula sp. TaxID=2593537 RepID=UPI0025C3B932|nr:ATP-dependent RecD-like DNA helicase [Desulfobacula sp.]MCD4722067.1 ATP-dependent RecD-like DNA helicase [Desulfobacula sp.]
MAHLKGHIERVTFSNEESAFCVCKLKVKDERDFVTIVGNMVNPIPGEFIEIKGKWIIHPQFGNQFQVQQYKTLVPATLFGIQKYLGSGLIKGIGPVMAKRIVERFGTQSLDIIEKNTNRLSQVEGIGKKRIEMIQQAWGRQKEVRAVMLFLQSHGVSTAYAAKIFKTYGQDSIHIVKENPYRLARDIFGIGFIIADSIAQKLGMEKDAPQRSEAGLEYVLYQLADDGHVCYPYHEFCRKVQEMLEVDKDIVLMAIKNFFLAGRIVIEDINENNQQVFLKKFHVCEIGIVNNFQRLKNSPKSIRKIDSNKAVKWIKDQIKIRLTKNQEAAVKKSLEEKILIITGGPGTGKTTIINAIIKILKKAGAKILLAAPTGRAAKKMSEATWEQARTIHRLLDYSMKGPGFKKNDKNPLKCDVLIIDEASMIDTVLMHHLLKAVPKEAILILVGDVNQLPSVGPGNVLNDLIISNTFSVVTLDIIFRQAKKSLIVVNAHRINKGMFPAVAKDKGDFYFVRKEEPEEVLNTIIDLVQNRIPDEFGYDPVDDIQVLTPMHKGIVGAGNLNHELQKILNPNKVIVQRGNREFKVSDKVMQIRNNYDKHTYNGDIGRIMDINLIDQTLLINFDKREVEYDFSNFDEIVHAYAVSVHKSQGSEYPVVIVPVVVQHYILLQRNLIYTAVTRGKKLVVLVGSKKALAIAISTVKSSKRYTRLWHRLKQ